jgi:hypothetical protein
MPSYNQPDYMLRYSTLCLARLQLTNMLYLLRSTLSGGTTLLQLTLRCSLLCPSVLRYYRLSTRVRFTLSGETTAYYLLCLLRSTMSVGTRHITRLSAILPGKTKADSLLRSFLSG